MSLIKMPPITKTLRRRKPRHPRPSIVPERMDFSFSDVPRHWFGNNPLLTHFLNALSLTFPDGERFFVDSVRAWRYQVTDSAQLKDIAGFIGQEAMHSLEHASFNQYLAAQGYEEEAQGGQKWAAYLIAQGRKHLSARRQLAATAGLEHITAIMANRLLKHPELIAEIDPSVRDLWVWHAIEKTEHKAVAFDLYQQVCGDYRLRVGIFLSASSFLLSYTGRYTYAFLKKDGLQHNPAVLARGMWRLFGYKGFISGMIPDYLSYLKPGFHPWDDDNSRLIAQWRATLYPEKVA